MSATEHPIDKASDEVAARFEAHRAAAREFNERAQKPYSLGGLFALLAGAAPILGAWSVGQLVGALPYVMAVLMFLASLFFVRLWVRHTARRLRPELKGYCEANDLDARAFVAHYEESGDYQFLASLIKGDGPLTPLDTAS